MEEKLIWLLSFATITSAGGAGLLGLRDLLGRRQSPDDSRSVPRIRRVPDKETGVSTVGSFDRWLERTLYLSGWPLSPLEATLVCLLSASVLGGAVFLLFDNLLFAGLTGLVGLTLPLAAIIIAHRKRQREFSEQFPDALHLLARAVRAGESLDQAIELVGESSREPLAMEFRRCAGHLRMGLSVGDAVRGLQQRTGLMDVRIFANTLSMHRDLGGRLAETLERLAEVIRDRHAFRRQLKSTTGAGRISAIFIATLGVLLFAYMFIFHPEYGRRLLEDSAGRMMLGYAIVSQLVGLFWISRLMKSDL